ncbi:hypothetical protein [Aliikangiella sp. IMCC44359]|uniref:hypothetical protein n=1 Tax=Aliikangiella sp. IMCC44359 TaxID=3459125 RepID=UPI00403AB56B
MKKFILGGITLLMSMSLYAVDVDNKRYVACDHCVSDHDFKDLAIQVGSSSFTPDTVIVVNTSNHSLLEIQQIGANPAIQSGFFKTIKITRSSGGPIFPFGMPGGEPGEGVSAQIISNEQSDINDYADYIELLNLVKDRQLSKVDNKWYVSVNLNDIGFVALGTQNMHWAHSNDFAAEYQGQLNSLLQSADINPFLFLKRPAIVKVETVDGYTVYLAKYPVINQWRVLFTRIYGELEFVDSELTPVPFKHTESTYKICVGHSWGRICRDPELTEVPSVTSYRQSRDDNGTKGLDRCGPSNPSCGDEQDLDDDSLMGGFGI